MLTQASPRAEKDKLQKVRKLEVGLNIATGFEPHKSDGQAEGMSLKCSARLMDIYIGKEGQILGPYYIGEVRKRLEDGRFDGTELAWHEALDEWTSIKEILGGDAGTTTEVAGGERLIEPESNQTATEGDAEPSNKETEDQLIKIKNLISEGHTDTALQLVHSLNNLNIYREFLEYLIEDGGHDHVAIDESIENVDFVFQLWRDVTDENLDKLQLRSVSDIKGIETECYNVDGQLGSLGIFSNLESLTLKDESIDDLTPLAELTQLKKLNLYFNNIDDLTPLADLTQLEELNLSCTDIVGLAPLAGMNNLKSLDLHNCYSIYDVTPLSVLTGLEELYLSEINVSSLVCLKGLTQLKRLSLSHAVDQEQWGLISDISTLAGFEELEFLDLECNKVRDLTPLAGLTELRVLNVARNQATNLAPLERLIHLEELDLRDNKISDWTVLARLTNLKRLNLGDSPHLSKTAIRELQETLPNCELVYSEDIGEESAASLEAKKAIEEKLREVADKPTGELAESDFNAVSVLRLDCCSITNLKQISELVPLGWLDHLKKLSLADNHLTDVSDLTELSRLTHLNISCNQINDVSVLSNLTQLQELNLSGNQLTDVSALAKLTQLTQLCLLNCQTSAEQINELQNRLPKCKMTRVIWQFETDGQVVCSPAIGMDGTVYVGSCDDKIYALDGSTGAKKWEIKTEGSVVSSPAIGEDGTVYVGSFDEKVYALDGATGSKKWEYATRGVVYSSPAIGEDGTIYVGSADGKIYALDGATGSKKWEYETEESVCSSPAIGVDGTVYIGSYDHKVYALDGNTGSKKWEYTTGYDILSSPAIGYDGTVYIGSMDWSVYALDGKSGDLVWEGGTYESLDGIKNSPAIGEDGTIYIGSSEESTYGGGALLGFDKETGKQNWEKWDFMGGVFSSPAIGDDGTLYIGSLDRGILAINLETGEELKIEAGAKVLSSPVIGDDGTVYIGADNGIVYAIKAGSTGYAKSSWPMRGQNPRHTGRVDVETDIEQAASN